MCYFKPKERPCEKENIVLSSAQSLFLAAAAATAGIVLELRSGMRYYAIFYMSTLNSYFPLTVLWAFAMAPTQDKRINNTVPATDKLLSTSTVRSIHQLWSYLYEESTNSTHTVHVHSSIQKYMICTYYKSLDSLHWPIAKGGCSVTSGCCLPSASDKWYSPKRALTQWQSSNSASFCRSRYFFPDSWKGQSFKMSVSDRLA